MALYTLQRTVSCIGRRPEVIEACLQNVKENIELLGATEVTIEVEQLEKSRIERLSYEFSEDTFGSSFHIAQHLAASGFTLTVAKS
ncbi:MAG: hypothetical protein WCV50_04160 [Patescibacteria group bacterium]